MTRVIIGSPLDELSIEEIHPVDLLDQTYNLNLGTIAGLFYLLYQASPIYLQPFYAYFQIQNREGKIYLPSDFENLLEVYRYSPEVPHQGESLDHFLSRSTFYLVEGNDLEVDVSPEGIPNILTIEDIEGRYVAFLPQINPDPEIPPNNMLLIFNHPDVLEGFTLGARLLEANLQELVQGLWIDGQWMWD